MVGEMMVDKVEIILLLHMDLPVAAAQVAQVLMVVHLTQLLVEVVQVFNYQQHLEILYQL